MKVVLLGTAPGSRLIAPWDDHSWEIWVCSAGNSQKSAPKRITRWFEIHALCDMMGAENVEWCEPYFKWLSEQSFPIYMQEKNEYVPQAVIFPYRKMVDRFGPNPDKGLANWFTSSIAWMMAYAIDMMRPDGKHVKNDDTIAIYGVDMAATEENYSAQKAGCHRFIEFARELGITVIVPFESCLGKTYPLYGYAEATNMGRKLQVRKHEMQRIRAQLDQQVRQGEVQRAYFDGALESINYDLRTWTNGMDAELDDDGVNDPEKIKADVAALGEAAKAYAQERVPLTGDLIESSGGVFVQQPTALASAIASSGDTGAAASTGDVSVPPKPAKPKRQRKAKAATEDTGVAGS